MVKHAYHRHQSTPNTGIHWNKSATYHRSSWASHLLKINHIPTINEVDLPPITGENTLSSQEQLGFQPIKPFMGASAHLKHTRVSPPNNLSQVQQLKYSSLQINKKAISVQSSFNTMWKFDTPNASKP
jgi:hypothetical protein